MAMNFEDFERSLWQDRAPAYERGFARLSAHTVPRLLAAAGVGPGVRTLDVGTGPGFVAAAAVRAGAQVSALDAEPSMVETAAHNVPGLDVRLSILPEVPFDDHAFDAVVGNFVINHVSDPVKTVRALRRVLRPGGRIALTCWKLPDGVPTAVGDALDRAGVPRPDDIPEPPFTPYGERVPFAGLFHEAGLTDVAAEDVHWHHLTRPEEWWDNGAGARIGTVGVIIGRQDASTVARVRAAYEEIVAVYAAGDGQVSLPAHALLAHGTRG
jgi:SAM-dependent methyltransferase